MGDLLIATAMAIDANSYVTVERADEIMRQRLYTDDWDNAGVTPAAEDYVVNDGGGALIVGDTTVPIDGGTGGFTVGCAVKFADHDQVYTVGTALTGDGNLIVSPGLVSVPADGERVYRLTAYEKEQALIWVTRLFDSMFEWAGSLRSDTQALTWPRYGVYDEDQEWYDEDEIPDRLEEAVADMALVLLGRNRFAEPEVLGQGFKSAKVGSISIDVDPNQQVDVIPPNIVAQISLLGRLKEEAIRAPNQVKVVTLRRA